MARGTDIGFISPNSEHHFNIKTENIYFRDLDNVSLQHLDTKLGHEILKKEKIKLLLNTMGDKFNITIDDIKEYLIRDDAKSLFPNISEIPYEVLLKQLGHITRHIDIQKEKELTIAKIREGFSYVKTELTDDEITELYNYAKTLNIIDF